MRRVTAQLVRDGFAAIGHTCLGVDTILVFESGIAKVDTALQRREKPVDRVLFLLSATWIERHPLDWRWLLSGLTLGVLLFCANLLRVAALIGTGQVLKWTLLAEMLHVPLGVLVWVYRRVRGGFGHLTAPRRPARPQPAPGIPQAACLVGAWPCA